MILKVEIQSLRGQNMKIPGSAVGWAPAGAIQGKHD